MTKFDALEEAHAELKLKDLLWNAIDEWDGLLADWTQVTCLPLVLRWAVGRLDTGNTSSLGGMGCWPTGHR